MDAEQERWHELREQAKAAGARIERQRDALWNERAMIMARNWRLAGDARRCPAIDRELAALAEQADALKAVVFDLEQLGERLGTYCPSCERLGRTCEFCARRTRKAVRAHGGGVRFAGGAVKALSDTKVRALGIVWGGEDLEGDQFVRGVTDLGASRSFVGMPVYYDHARRVKAQVGVVTYASENDEGITFEVELDKANRYFETVQRLIRMRKLGSSTGALAHTVVRKAGRLLRWHIGELSFASEPMEPRTMGRVAPM